nr:YfhO family protein [Candidatus Levybacteria bacterium]
MKIFKKQLLKKIFPFLQKNKDDFIFSGIITIIVLLFLIPSFIRKDLTGDFIGQDLPWYHFTFINLKHGIIPFWSPYSYSGIPHLLKPELAIAHPLTILTMLIDLIFNRREIIGITGQIMELACVIGLCISAIGTYLFSRKILFLSSIPALFASLAYSLNLFTITQMHSVNVFYGAVLLPWLIFSVVRFIKKPSYASFLFVVLCNYLLLIGYSYHYVYFFIMQLGLVVFYGIKRILLFIFAFLTSLSLSSFFLLPYLDLYSKSPRNIANYDLSFHSISSLTPFKLLEIINPISLSTNINSLKIPTIFDGPTLTWGTFAFVFLIFGLFSLKKDPIYKWLVAVLFISLFYSFGGNLYSHNFFGSIVPLILKFRFHARALICTIFAGALLIGIGAQTIQNQIRIKYVELFFWIFSLLLLFSLIVGQVFFINRFTLNNIEILKGVSITLLFLMSSLAIIALTIKYGKKSFLVIGLILMLLEQNLFFQNYKYFFTNNITYNQFYKINPLIPEIPSKNNLFRMYFEDNQFAYNTSVFNIYNLTGYENSPPRSFGERQSLYGPFRFYQISNVKYVVTTTDNLQIGNPEIVKIKTILPASYPNETFFAIDPSRTQYIYEIKNYLPRFFVPSIVVPCNKKECLSIDNPPKIIVAKNLPQEIKNSTKNASIQIEDYTPNKIVLRINSQQKTFIASSETYDQGWKLKVNNKTSYLYNVSNGVRGFFVPAGQSIIEMTYFPPYLSIGLFISILTIIFLIIFWKLNKKFPYFS